MRYVHPSGATPPLPYDPVPHDAFAPIILPSDGNGKAGWWKKVLITSHVILVFGIWMKGGNIDTSDCPT
jgi:hypothetical protein